MRTSLTEVKTIEEHLLNQLSGPDEALFQAHLLLNAILRERMEAQQQSYQLIQDYGRRQLRQHIQQVEQKLFAAPEHQTFRQKILALFSRR